MTCFTHDWRALSEAGCSGPGAYRNRSRRPGPSARHRQGSARGRAGQSFNEPGE